MHVKAFGGLLLTFLSLTCLSLSLGCGHHKTHLTECESARQQLEARVDDLVQQNERLLIEKRSAMHRVAEAEKQLARAATGDYVDYQRPVADEASNDQSPTKAHGNSRWRVKE